MASLVFTELLGGGVFEIDAGLDESSLRTLGGGGLRGPSGPGRDPSGAVVVAEITGDGIALADQGGAWTLFGTSGAGDGQFRRPAAAAFTGGGMVVLDSGNCRLVFLDDIGGSGWSTYGHRGMPSATNPAVGAYADPRGLAVDSSGRIWVADPGSQRLTRIDRSDGSGWCRISLPPASAPSLPYGLCAFRDGVLVLDVGNRRVLVVDDVDTVEVALDDPSFVSPGFVAAVNDDDIVLADLRANELRLVQFDGAGFVDVARLRGSPPDVVVPLFDSIGGVGA